jgi:hypothetical protein
MKLRGCILLLVSLLCVYTASAQKTEREKVYQVIANVMEAKSYAYFLQYVDVVNGVAINGTGIENRMTDDVIKQRAIYTNTKLFIALQAMEDIALVVEGNMAMANMNTQVMSVDGSSLEQTGEYENMLLLRKLEGKWKMVRWLQIKIERPQQRPPRREWR